MANIKNSSDIHVPNISRATSLVDLKNGRVLMEPSECDTFHDYPTYITEPDPRHMTHREANVCNYDESAEFESYQNLRNIQVRTPLSDVVFSKENLKRLEDKIRYVVWQKSGEVIDFNAQTKRELAIILRGLFLQNSNFDSSSYEAICKDLSYINNLVVNYSVAKILSSLESDKTYRYDVENMYSPIMLPVSTDSKGSRTLPSVFTTF